MGLFDRFRRQSFSGPAGVRARLEGTMSRRRLRGWSPPLENINTLVASGGPRLLARSPELVVTKSYAANACETFARRFIPINRPLKNYGWKDVFPSVVA